MSNAASPRPSTNASSRRTSLESSTTTSRSATTQPAPETQRRNRAALRDYYGLKNAAKDKIAEPVPPEEVEQISQLDKEGFNAEEYVKDLLARENLEGALKAENGLVSEIRGLDGERKSLVYDNYSKLITATDTIRRMRTSMDPLTPTTSTLSPAIAHIAETASTLSNNLVERTAGLRREAEQSGRARSNSRGSRGKIEDKERQQNTVRWVLDGPQRLEVLVNGGRQREAENQWAEIKSLLEKWDGVKGVEETKMRCEEAMKAKAVG
ncbi:MAG: hypothetical protein M1820_009689 [Bogoriella megaspora]|nr:MAG: hypothetical protein M1820_009689 [Bogoriella megaspora]